MSYPPLESPSPSLRGPQPPRSSGKSDKPRLVFFARVKHLGTLELLEFYAEDIRALESLGFDVICTNSYRTVATSGGTALFAWWWHSSLPAILIWKARRRPVLVTGATHLSERQGRLNFRGILRLVLTIIATRASSINLAISAAEQRDLRRIHAPNIRSFPCSVDTDFFRPKQKSDTPSAVIIAQLNPASIRRKGVDIAISAAAQLTEEIDGFHLSIVGPSTPEGEILINELRARSLGASVSIHGELSRSAKRDLLSRAWFYIQPSTYEGFGLAVLEGMASGAIPICSLAGSLPEVVGAGGVLLRSLEPSSFTRAIAGLVADSDHRNALAAAARDQALRFDRQRHIQDLASVLQSVGVELA